MDRDKDHDLRESIMVHIQEMDADTLRQLLAYISGLEAQAAERWAERDDPE